MIPAVRDSLLSDIEATELALGDVYRLHARTVSRWVGHLAGPTLDVEDLVHEVFLVVQRRLGGFREKAKLTTWLYRITQHVVRNARRRQRFRRWVGQLWRAEQGDGFSRSPRTPGTDMERREDVQLVYRALDRLPEKYRTPLVLFELEGLSGLDIAAMTGVRVGTVWVQIHRGRVLFLDALKEFGTDGSGEA